MAEGLPEEMAEVNRFACNANAVESPFN